MSTLPGRVVDAFAQCLGALEKLDSGPLHEWLVEQAQISVGDLREAVAKADFEAAQEATMALCFVFEPRTCEALMPLLGELPRLRTPDSEAAMWIDSVAALETAAQLLRSIAGKRRRSN